MRSEKVGHMSSYGGLIACASEEWRHQSHEQVRGQGGWIATAEENQKKRSS